MKNILVPTDFSACASNATNVALQLASTYGATLHLFSQIDVRDQTKSHSPEELQIIHNTEVLLEEWKQKAANKAVPIKTAWSAGKLIESINNYIQSNAIDFVVMGSHGLSGKNEHFLGSNTQKVVRTIHAPVMVIKEEVLDYQIKKVVFASNFNLSEKVAFQYLLDFVKPCKPEIHLIQINTSGWFSEPYLLVKESMNDFKKMCGDLTCKTHFFRDWTIDAGIRHLSKKIGADLVAISNQQRHPLKRIFAGSNVEALVNHAEMPVLSIDLRMESDSDNVVYRTESNEESKLKVQ